VDPSRTDGGVVTDREQLQQVLTFVQRLSDENWWLLAEACRLMDDHAWVGPTAREFAADQQARSRTLQAALRDSVDLIKQQLARLPVL
jgi:hypothetical protein